jgi:ferredoxin-thioredoxin reductase catalytic subunit
MAHVNKKLIVAGLEENERRYGKKYCPCVPKYLYDSPNSDDYVCACKEFRETGHCHCGLFEDRKIYEEKVED